MAVLGAGAIGVEFAYFYNALGTKVTLIEMMPNHASRAAFPSLHAAVSFVCLYYAWRYCRWFFPILLFFVVGLIASTVYLAPLRRRSDRGCLPRAVDRLANRDSIRPGRGGRGARFRRKPLRRGRAALTEQQLVLDSGANTRPAWRIRIVRGGSARRKGDR
jgi:hypothetical protein